MVGRARSRAGPRRARRACALMSRRTRPPPVAPRPRSRASARRRLRDHGGAGPPAILVPSLINPPHILDLDAEVSLAAAIAGMGRRVLLLDWGEARERGGPQRLRPCRALLLPLLARARRAAGAGRLLPRRDDGDRRRQPRAGASASPPSPRRGTSPLIRPTAAPALHAMWRARASAAPRRSARCRWRCCRPPSGRSTPSARCRKFAKFAALDPASAEARRFVAARGLGQPGRAAALRRRARTDRGVLRRRPARQRRLADRRQRRSPTRSTVPALHFTAGRRPHRPRRHRARRRQRVEIASGHVGMIVGTRARPAPRRASSAFSTLLAAKRATCAKRDRHAPVAQLDRVLPSEGRGHRFESCRVRHICAAFDALTSKGGSQWRRSCAFSTTIRSADMPSAYPRDDLPKIERYPDGQTLPTPKAIDFQPGELLGCVSGELGLRHFLESARPHARRHLRQGRPGQRVRARAGRCRRRHLAALLAGLSDRRAHRQGARTSSSRSPPGSAPTMSTCRRRSTRGITVAEVTYCNSISVAEHVVMMILGAGPQLSAVARRGSRRAAGTSPIARPAPTTSRACTSAPSPPGGSAARCCGA